MDFEFEKTFGKGLSKAELETMGASELDSYENSLKVYRDLKGVIDTAFDEGKIEGKLEGKLEVAKALKASGISSDVIIKATGLSQREIDDL